MITEEMFQSTPPRGGRRRIPPPCTTRKSFNPRPRVGGDVHPGDTLVVVDVFQSTPPRGGRRLGLPDL